MRNPRQMPRRLIAWWLLLSLGLSSLSASAHALGEVLCFGNDGHVAIERALGRDCVEYVGGNETRLDTVHQRQTEVVLSKHCGSCFDVELSNSNPISLAKLPVTPEFRSIELPAIVESNDDPWSTASPATVVDRVINSPKLVSRVLLERRTVVLVI